MKKVMITCCILGSLLPIGAFLTAKGIIPHSYSMHFIIAGTILPMLILLAGLFIIKPLK